MTVDVSLRWLGKEDDLDIYNSIFISALQMSRLPSMIDQSTAKLLFMIINQWEKDRRSIPLAVISAAWDLAGECELELVELEGASG